MGHLQPNEPRWHYTAIWDRSLVVDLFILSVIHSFIHSFILFFGFRMSLDYSRATRFTCPLQRRSLMTLSLWSSSVPSFSLVWLFLHCNVEVPLTLCLCVITVVMYAVTVFFLYRERLGPRY